MELTNMLNKTLPATYIRYINRDQLVHIIPRLAHEQNDLITFAESIHRFGLLEPIRVFYDTHTGKHLIISGERRFAALSLLGRTRVMCHVITDRKVRDATIISEYCLKEGADIFRACRALEYLIDECGYTPLELAHFSGISPTRINRILRLGQLSADERRKLSLARMSEQVCSEIALIEDTETRSAVIDYLIKHTPALCDALRETKKEKKPFIRTFKCDIVDNSVARLKRMMDNAGFNSRFDRKITERDVVYTISLQK